MEVFLASYCLLFLLFLPDIVWDGARLDEFLQQDVPLVLQVLHLVGELFLALRRDMELTHYRTKLSLKQWQ